jgi:hypothetical protein
MTKSLNDLLDDYGDACYSNTDEAWAVRREITKLFDSRQKQKPIAYITGWYGGYQTINVITGAVLPNGTPLYTVPPTQKPLTDDEIIQIAMKVAVEAGADHISVEDIKNPSSGVMQLARALETAHGITP